MPPAVATLDSDALFRAVPCPLLVVAADAPRFTITAVSDAYLAATLTTREIIGSPLFQVFPDNPAHADANGVRNLTASLLRVIESGTADTMPLQRYDIPQRGVVREFAERHWVPQNAPYAPTGGAPSHVIHRVEDVTSIVRAGHETDGTVPVAQKHVVRLGSHLDLPRLRDVVRHVASGCELDELSAMDLLVAASELGRGLVGEGGNGAVEVSALGFDLPRGVRLRFRAQRQDSGGPPEKMTTDSAALTLGFYGPRQLVDHVHVETEPAATTVTITKWKRRTRSRGTPSSMPPRD